MPCVMHFNVGHFAAITATRDGQYQIKDPTFDTAGSRWMSERALEAESDGYFLVSTGKLPEGWQCIDKQEAESIWGKGFGTAKDTNAKTPDCPQTSPPPPCNDPNKPCGCQGMAQAGFFDMQATSHIFDTPLKYTAPIGPAMDFRVNYNYLENNQPSTFTFSNLGQDWTFNWCSYLTLDGSKNATVRVRGGGCEVYTNTGTVGSPAYATPDLTSQSSLAIVSGIYQRQLPDGSIEVFNDTDGSGRMFMTASYDPHGNCVSIQYDSNFRIATITDAIGRASTVSYASNTFGASGFYNITQITDPFGRSAAFAYDSTYTFLVSITDQIGLVSQFVYDTSSNFITLMTTPYGSTAFYQYTPAQPGVYSPTGLRMTFPDGTSAVVENWVNVALETFYWDREAMSLYPNDPAGSINPVYSGTWHCAVTEWQLEGPSTSIQSPVPNWYQPRLFRLARM